MSKDGTEQKYAQLEDESLNELIECLRTNGEIGAKQKAALQGLKIVQQRSQSNSHMLAILWSMRMEVGTPKEKRDFALQSDPTLRKKLKA